MHCAGVGQRCKQSRCRARGGNAVYRVGQQCKRLRCSVRGGMQCMGWGSMKGGDWVGRGGAA